jgi:DNA-binding NarL/FixJ family response regulator
VAVIAEAADGDEAVALASQHDADVVVMDIDMPNLDGIGATKQIARIGQGAKVLMLSSLKGRDEVLAAVRAGASGYLLKTAGAREITDAIARIRDGEIVFPPELAGVVLAEVRNPHQPTGVAALTDRENEVLALMAGGRSNQAISTELQLSSKTIEAHVSSIFVKLGLEPTPDQHRRVQAVVAYLQDARPGRA